MKQFLGSDIFLEGFTDHLEFGNSKLVLRFSSQSGDWQSLCVDNAWLECNSAGTVQFHIGGETRHFEYDLKGASYHPGERNHYVSKTSIIGTNLSLQRFWHETNAGAVTLSLEQKQDDYTVVQRYTLYPDSAFANRNATLEYRGHEETKLRYTDFFTPAVITNPGDCLAAPAFALVPNTPVSSLPQGRWIENLLASTGNDGLMFFNADFGAGCLGISQPNHTVLALCYTELEMSSVDTLYTPPSLQIAHRFQSAAYLYPNSAVTVGTQLISVAKQLEPAIIAMRQALEKINVAVPSSTSESMKQLRIFEAHIGPKFMNPFLPSEENCYEPYPTLDNLRQDLERIQGMGYNTLQLMPHFTFPGYTVDDYLDVDSQYGGAEGLKRLTTRAHELGVQVILDVILHGSVDQGRERYAKWARPRSHYLDEHPEWFMRTESGEIAVSFTYAFDATNQGFQDYFIQVMRTYILEYGADGFRIDAPTWNAFPNWDKNITYRAGSSSFGVIEMFKRAREDFKDIPKEIILYTEPSGPSLHTVFDITYSYDELWLLSSLVKPISPKYGGKSSALKQQISAAQMRTWYKHKQLLYPKDGFARVVRHIDSHDSFEWKGMGQFKYEAFGTPATRAMFVCNALLKGGIMNFVGGEHGSEDFYREVLALRGHPAFTDGTINFDLSECDHDMVFHLVHQATQNPYNLVVLVNFKTEAINCILTLKAADTAKVLHGRETAILERHASSLGFALEPFETMILEVAHG